MHCPHRLHARILVALAATLWGGCDFGGPTSEPPLSGGPATIGGGGHGGFPSVCPPSDTECSEAGGNGGGTAGSTGDSAGQPPNQGSADAGSEPSSTGGTGALSGGADASVEHGGDAGPPSDAGQEGCTDAGAVLDGDLDVCAIGSVHIPYCTVLGDVTAIGCSELTSIDAPWLAQVGGEITLGGGGTGEGNPLLVSLNMPALVSTGGTLHIANAGALTKLDLPALAALGGHLRIHDNPVLRQLDLPALAAINTANLPGSEDLQVTAHPQLPPCFTEALAVSLGRACGDAITLCDGNAGTESLCMQTCCPGELP